MHTRYIILQYHYHGILLHILLSCRITVLISICNMSTLLKTLVSDSEQMRYILPGDIVNQQCLHHCRTRIPVKIDTSTVADQDQVCTVVHWGQVCFPITVSKLVSLGSCQLHSAEWPWLLLMYRPSFVYMVWQLRTYWTHQRWAYILWVFIYFVYSWIHNFRAVTKGDY